MLRARAGDLYILGIDAENVRRLQAGQPIHLDLATLGGDGRLLLLYGPTLGDVQRQLEEANGAPLPPASPLITPQSNN